MHPDCPCSEKRCTALEWATVVRCLQGKLLLLDLERQDVFLAHQMVESWRCVATTTSVETQNGTSTGAFILYASCSVQRHA